MAHFYRLILGLLFSGSAFALSPVQQWSWSFGSGSGSGFGSFSAACSAGVAYVRSFFQDCTYNGNPCTWAVDMTGGSCQAVRNGNTSYTVSVGSSGSACPAHSTPSESSCVCDEGYTDNGTSCDMPACPPMGTPAGDGLFGPLDSEPPGYFCHESCKVYPDSVWRGSNGKWWVRGPFTHTGGAHCTVGPPSTDPNNGDETTGPEVPSTAPTVCEKGLCPGQVNDKDVCLPCGGGKDTTQSSKESTTKDKDGNDVRQTQDVQSTTSCKDGKCTTTKTTTTKTSAKGPDGGPLPSDGTIGETNTVTETTTNADGTKSVTTTTTETQTTCTASGCSKTTTVTKATSKVAADGNPLSPPTTTVTSDTKKYSRSEFCESQPLNPACRGETSKVETETKDQASFCKENPKSPFCIESSFGGGCGGPPSCTGDAIQCAMATMQHEMKCALFDQTNTPEQLAYELAKGKTGNVTGDNPNNEIVSLAGRLSMDNVLSGQCIGDKTVTVAGSSVTLPFSMICQHLETLGNVLVAVSMLLAIRIVSRG